MDKKYSLKTIQNRQSSITLNKKEVMQDGLL